MWRNYTTCGPTHRYSKHTKAKVPKKKKPNMLSITHYLFIISIRLQKLRGLFILSFLSLFIFIFSDRVSRNWVCDWDACNSFIWFGDDTIVCNVVDCGSNMIIFLFIFFLFFLSLALKCISQQYSSSFHLLKLARVHIQFYMEDPCFIFLK